VKLVGDRVLKAYRIYIVGSDGRLQLGKAFEATDDIVAGATAETHAVRGQIAELWEGGRMVGRVSKHGVFTQGDR
jgi:hypothetical protein